MIRSDGLRRFAFGNLYHLDHFCMLINLKAEGDIPVYDNKILAFHKRCLLIGLIKTGFQKHDFFFKRQPSIRKPVLTRGCTSQHRQQLLVAETQLISGHSVIKLQCKLQWNTADLWSSWYVKSLHTLTMADNTSLAGLDDSNCAQLIEYSKKSDQKLKTGKAVLVTGASSGIGAGVAVHLATLGCRSYS